MAQEHAEELRVSLQEAENDDDKPERIAFARKAMEHHVEGCLQIVRSLSASKGEGGVFGAGSGWRPRRLAGGSTKTAARGGVARAVPLAFVRAASVQR